MGVLDFLFEGSPPPSTTTYGSTTENMPQWMSDYVQGLIQRSNQIAGEEYQSYGGPRVAGFTDDQTNAWDVIRNNIGGWNEEFGKAGEATEGGLSQAMPHYGAASSMFNSATGATPDKIGEYMSPYASNVIDRARLEAGRAWNEDIMPSISGRFIRGGQSGSTAHQEQMSRAGRDVTEGLHSQSLAALDDAYAQAGTMYGADANRQLAAGQGLAGIGTDLGKLGLESGQQFADLARQRQEMGLKDAGALEAVGNTQQQQTQRNLDVAYGDFERQRDYPQQQASWLADIIQGLPRDSTRNTTETGPSDVYQPSPLSQLISMYGLYKDVTDKARGGVVHKAEGGLAQAGYVNHIPGPIPGHMRYAEGGKVGRTTAISGALRRILEGRGAVDRSEIDDDRAHRSVEIYKNAGIYPRASDREIWAEMERLAGRKITNIPSVKKIQGNKVKKAMGGLAMAGY